MGKNKKKSSKHLASEAAKVLQDPNASAVGKSLAASLLSQANTENQTGPEMEALASKVLRSNHYSEQNQTFAASLVSQSNKDG